MHTPGRICAKLLPQRRHFTPRVRPERQEHCLVERCQLRHKSLRLRKGPLHAVREAPQFLPEVLLRAACGTFFLLLGLPFSCGSRFRPLSVCGIRCSLPPGYFSTRQDQIHLIQQLAVLRELPGNLRSFRRELLDEIPCPYRRALQLLQHRQKAPGISCCQHLPQQALHLTQCFERRLCLLSYTGGSYCVVSAMRPAPGLRRGIFPCRPADCFCFRIPACRVVQCIR